MAAAGCTYVAKAPLPPKQDVPSGSTSTCPTLTTKVKMEHVPAVGRLALPALGGLGLLHRSPSTRARSCHNLEHGGVMIWWGPKVPKATIDELRAFYNESPTGMFGTPIAGLGNKVAISAWTGDPTRYYRNGYHGIGHLAVCPRFDKHGVHGLPGRLPGPGARGDPPGSRSGGQRASRRLGGGAILARPGWRNWRDAPGLKPGVPAGAYGFESRPRQPRKSC